MARSSQKTSWLPGQMICQAVSAVYVGSDLSETCCGIVYLNLLCTTNTP